MSRWMPLWWLWMWNFSKEICSVSLHKRKFKSTCTYPSWRSVEYSSTSFLKFCSGGVTENFDFEIDEESEVWESCSAMLNGNMYIFGGHRNKDVGYKRNQVSNHHIPNTVDISGALFTLRIQFEHNRFQCQEGAKYVRVNLRTRIIAQ